MAIRSLSIEPAVAPHPIMKPDPSWIPRALEGDLERHEQTEFIHAMQENAALQEEWAKHAELHGLLGPVMEQAGVRDGRVAECLEAATEADQNGFVSAVRRKIMWVQFRQRAAWSAAAVFVVGMLTFWNLASRTAVATVVNADGSRTLQEGARFSKGDTLKIDKGLVELDLDGRGRMIVEGPSEITWTDPLGSKLESGRVFLKINERGHGYRLATPQGSVVDLGTEFGVAIDPITREVETHVILGEVEARPGKAAAPVRLKKNEALRFSTARSEKIEANADAFYRSLPPPRNSDMTMVHWSMDADENSIVHPRTHKIDQDSTILRLENNPEPVEGPFGSAFHFNGRRAYAESDYPGIGGNHPRTVAFWVKVPADWKPNERFAMISWGRFLKSGTGKVWQVAINHMAEQGPVGRLWLDAHGTKTFGTKTFGSTDMRDGKWHHVAVVLYPAGKESSQQQVTIYVDGEIESLTSRSIGPINTDINKDRFGVRLASDNRGYGGGPRLFRGALDEVYIFDNVLSHSEIRTLMERNEPPVPIDP